MVLCVNEASIIAAPRAKKNNDVSRFMQIGIYTISQETVSDKSHTRKLEIHMDGNGVYQEVGQVQPRRGGMLVFFVRASIAADDVTEPKCGTSKAPSLESWPSYSLGSCCSQFYF